MRSLLLLLLNHGPIILERRRPTHRHYRKAPIPRLHGKRHTTPPQLPILRHPNPSTKPPCSDFTNLPRGQKSARSHFTIPSLNSGTLTMTLNIKVNQLSTPEILKYYFTMTLKGALFRYLPQINSQRNELLKLVWFANESKQKMNKSTRQRGWYWADPSFFLLIAKIAIFQRGAIAGKTQCVWLLTVCGARKETKSKLH